MASRHKDWALDVLADRFTNEPFTSTRNNEFTQPGLKFNESLKRAERGIPEIPEQGLVLRLYSSGENNGQNYHVKADLLRSFIENYRRRRPFSIAVLPEMPSPLSDWPFDQPVAGHVQSYELVIVRVTDQPWISSGFALIEPGFCPPVALKITTSELFL